MEKLNNMMIYHELPALIVENNKGKELVIFSNVNEEFVACKIDFEDRDNKEIYDELVQNGFFDCITNSSNYKSDELTLVLSLTEKCNCRCRYCFLDANICGKVMTKELLRDSIDKAIELANGRIINLSAFGGEPGTETDLLTEMVEYSKTIKNQKFKYSITTNGIFNEKVLKLLIDNKFSVSFSMDGLPMVQNYQRPLANGKDSYNVVEPTLKKLVENNINLKVRCTVTKFSVDKMVETVRWLHNIGVEKVHFEPVTPGGRGCNDNDLLQPPSARDFAENLIAAIKVGSNLGVDVICFPYMNMMIAPIIFCDGNINNRLVVSPEGVLSTCVEVQKREHELFSYLGLGNYNFENRTFDIEYNERRGAKRGCEALKESKRACKLCPLKFFCGGGCPTRNYRGTGNSEKVDEYRCDIIRLVMPYVLTEFYKSTFLEGGVSDEES